ncbi:uncharacterized protein FFE2_07870 [Fusarium fujikuroi]|nr:uncharacterized protein FFE2_07870 [Fusarium fujikuroi]
MQFYTSCSNSL